MVPEFKREVEVMASHWKIEVTISQQNFRTYPSSFMQWPSMNPVSGYFNDPNAPVQSSPAEMQRYLRQGIIWAVAGWMIYTMSDTVPFEKLTEERLAEESRRLLENDCRKGDIQNSTLSRKRKKPITMHR
jgi:magnesium chelatase family protein